MRTLEEVLRDLSIVQQSPAELIRDGITGSKVWKVFAEGQVYLVKIADPSFIAPELQQVARLVPYLDGYLPSMRGAGRDFICREFLQGDTWYEAIRKSDRSVMSFAQEVFPVLADLWVRTAGQPCTRHLKHLVIPEYLFRFVEESFGDMLDKALVVNGEKGVTLLQGLAMMRRLADQPVPVRCLTHGDTYGEHIIGTRLIDPRLDCVDWVFDLSGLLMWRSSFTVGSLESSLVTPDGRVELNYDARFGSLCGELEAIAWQYGRQVAQQLGDKSWEQRLRIYLGRRYLSEIKYHDQRVSLGILLANPHLKNFLLGEALRHFHFVQG